MDLNFNLWSARLGAIGLILGFVTGMLRAEANSGAGMILGNGLGAAVVLGIALAVVGWVIDRVKK